MRGMALLALSLLLGAAGCATLYNPATGRQETVLDTQVENALGVLARAQMGLGSLQIGKVAPEQFARAQTIGKKLARVSDRQDLVYQFGVIQDKELNAFTLPGGTIYIHTGVLGKASDDELAGVIAHEIGHVAARHVAKHLQANLGFAVAIQLAQAAGVGAESAQVANSLYQLFSRGFSRQDELEADRLGIRYADRAGFNPRGLVDFFKVLEEEEREKPYRKAVPVWQSTHPLTSERIAKAQEELKKVEGKFCPTCGRSYPIAAGYCAQDGTLLKEKKR